MALSTPPSTATRRQFEQTAIAKLVAEGVPRHLASAFVMQGIPNSGQYDRIKDQVCRMKFEKMFVEASPADFENPMRLGAYVPQVVTTKTQRFHTEFRMSDLEAAKFARRFPEFDVVARGKVHNPHGYYANSRYAECELLIAMVFDDAERNGRDHRSLIDLGGNAVWHGKRGREYVRCNNPVLSPRDVMRYKTREIFSGSPTAQTTDLTYGQDSYSADYTIAVHSTYDITPKSLAYAMHKKKVKKFFGVVNVMPGLDTKGEGVYETDGVTFTLVRPPREPPFVRCGFRHDPSLEYRHKLSTMRSYLNVCRRYDFYDDKGHEVSYTYRIHSVRGSSLIFTISLGDSGYYSNNALWTPPTRKLYWISIKFLNVRRMEVEAEFFDRLVLQVAGARNVETYDIVSLFRYGKSLRQRVSINGIVLSSGYTQTPDQLVNCVIAAYAVAAAYRVESGQFFKEATSQIISLRGQGFYRDLFRIVGKTMLNTLLALPAALSELSGLSALDAKIKALIATKGSIDVEIDKPHSTHGIGCVPDMFVKTGADRRSELQRLSASTHTPLAPGGLRAPLASTYTLCDDVPVRFRSYGIPSLDASEIPKPTSRPLHYQFDTDEGWPPIRTEEFRSRLYSEAFRKVATMRFGETPVILHNGDRMYRRFVDSAVDEYELGSEAGAFIGDPHVYIIFRGVGTKAVSLEPPACYERGRCLRFVLFYEDWQHEGSEGSTVTRVDDDADRVGQPDRPLENEETWVFELDASPPSVVRFSNQMEGTAFVHQQLDQGRYYMSGAIGNGNSLPPTPPRAHSPGLESSMQPYRSVFVKPDESLVGEASDSVGSGDDAREQHDSGTVSSSEVVPGKASMQELLDLCDKSKQVALATSRLVVDMAIAIANGDAVAHRWHSMVQGHPGNLLLVKVEGDLWSDYFTRETVDHMAVSDGDDVFDRLSNLPSDGVYVTSDEMKIYVGGGIRQSIASVISDPYSCEVIGMNGTAGSGKTYSIVQGARASDVVVCETSGSLEETATKLAAKPYWTGHAYTVDAFLLHRPVKAADTLWVDESYRLHAGKIFSMIKMLKPRRVLCFGDDKQIPILPFVPDFDLVHHRFPFTRIDVKRETYRSPADVCMVTSQPKYYGYHVTTHNPVVRSIRGPVQYETGMFKNKSQDWVLLVFTKNAKADLVSEGVKGVWTIGEAQGKTFDNVIVFREKELKKALYYSIEQSLVALTRHRRRFQFVTAAALLRGDTHMDDACAYLKDKADELLLSSHLVAGLRPAANADELEARRVRESQARRARVLSWGSASSSFEEVENADWTSRIEEVLE